MSFPKEVEIGGQISIDMLKYQPPQEVLKAPIKRILKQLGVNSGTTLLSYNFVVTFRRESFQIWSIVKDS